MNEINSDDWILLADVARRYEPSYIMDILSYMAEETENYQKGNCRYPKVEFAISLIIDKKTEERRVVERRELLEKEKRLKPSQPIVKEEEKEKEQEPIESPRTRRLKIRDSWLNKFKEAEVVEAEPIVKEVVKEPEPVVEPVKVVKIKRKLKKSAAESAEGAESVATVAEVKPKRKYTKKKDLV